MASSPCFTSAPTRYPQLTMSDLNIGKQSKALKIFHIVTEAANVERLLQNEATGILADGAVLNAATMLYLGGKAATIQNGIPMARQALRSGAAHGAFVKIRDFQLSVASNTR